MNKSIIECQKVQTAYTKNLNRPILNGIDCQINQGEFVVLLGLNGAGKSTLLRSMVGLVPVEQGAIHINGTLLNSRSLPAIRRQVGMLFQGGGLINQLSAIENVMCGRFGSRTSWQTLFGFPKKDRRHALELLEQFGLREQADQKTSQLSGGQQQRVAIARALIQSPEILLADEPITGFRCTGLSAGNGNFIRTPLRTRYDNCGGITRFGNSCTIRSTSNSFRCRAYYPRWSSIGSASLF